MCKYTLDWTENRLSIFSLLATGRSVILRVIFQYADNNTSFYYHMACLLFSSVLIDQTLSLLPYRRPDRNIKRNDQLENLLELPFWQSYYTAVICLFCLSTFFASFRHLRFSLCVFSYSFYLVVVSSYYISNHPHQQNYCFLLTVSVSRYWHNNFWPVPFLSSIPTLITWFWYVDIWLYVYTYI